MVSTFPFDLKMRISADWLQLFGAIDAGARLGMSPTVLSGTPMGVTPSITRSTGLKM